MKRAIDGLVLALALVLVATGGWWMWTGWDVVQVERGWAAVISGSMMLTGGFVLLGIVWAVSRLAVPALAAPAAAALDAEPSAPAEFAPTSPAPVSVAPPSFDAGKLAIGGAAAAATFGAASAFGQPRRDEDPAEVAETDLAPCEPLDDVVEEDETPKQPAQLRPTIGDLMRRIGPSSPPPLSDEPALPQFEEPSIPRFDEPAESKADEDAFRDEDFLDEDFFAERDVTEREDTVRVDAAVAETERHEPEEEDEVRPAAEDMSIPGLDADQDDSRLPPAGPIFPSPRVTEAAPPVSIPTYLDKNDDEEGDWFDQAERSLDRALGRPPRTQEQEADDTPVEPEPPKPPPAVTGRYSSGDTNYVMFDDGSIEAQTPEGVMRFASLVELRRFVEQRQ